MRYSRNVSVRDDRFGCCDDFQQISSIFSPRFQRGCINFFFFEISLLFVRNNIMHFMQLFNYSISIIFFFFSLIIRNKEKIVFSIVSSGFFFFITKVEFSIERVNINENIFQLQGN